MVGARGCGLSSTSTLGQNCHGFRVQNTELGRIQYAELHAHTNFSFLNGASHPEEMISQASELGLSALAVTDHNGVYGAVRFARAASDSGLKSIIGMELTLAGGYHITLLARDRVGYANICRLATKAHRWSSGRKPTLPFEDLSGYTTGLVALSGCCRGEIPAAALKGDLDHAAKLTADYSALFEPGCFFLELYNHLQEEDLVTGNALVTVAARTGVSVVATNNAHYHHPGRSRLQDVLTCIKHTETLDTIGSKLLPNSEFCLKSPAAMASLFSDLPEAIQNTLHIADMCSFDLSSKLEYGLPTATVPAGYTEFTYIEKLVWDSVRVRYKPLADKVCKRVSKELSYIRKHDLAGYFLTAREIIQFCNTNNILVNTRGSAPGSILCYALGISMVDPIAAGLLFERFMSSDRIEPPDIDLDIEHQERERVIQYIYKRYGREHAAMVANVVSYRDRSAVRDVGKVFGLPVVQLERLSMDLSWKHSDGPDTKLDQIVETPTDISNHIATEFITISNEIQDFPRHLSIHTGGIIISSRPLVESVPIQPASMEGRTIVQWDKDDCSNAGLIKIDLLGLGMMTLIHRAFRLIERHHGHCLTLSGFTFNDSKVYDAICDADTVGVFQLESRAQMAALPRTRPRTFYDLVVEIAIIRPGPMSTKMHRNWILRRLGYEPVTYLAPALEPVLKRTLGLPIFQEQCMQMAMAVAGFSAARADALRQAMSRKRSIKHIQSLQADLISGMSASGVPKDIQEEIYSQIEGYAGYGFPEAHACAFALLVYVSAWLKVHYPTEFTCAILNSQPMGFYHPHTLIGDAQRHGVVVLPIDIRYSRYECTLEAGALRIGYCYVDGLGKTFQKVLDQEIELAPYRSLEDFCQRTRLPAQILEHLAIAGAFSGFKLERRDALWHIHTYATGKFGNELPGFADKMTEHAFIRPANEMVQAQMDFAVMGHSASFRGMEFHRALLSATGFITVAGLTKLAERVRAQTWRRYCTDTFQPIGAFCFLAIGDSRNVQSGTLCEDRCSEAAASNNSDRNISHAMRSSAYTGVLVKVAGLVINRQRPEAAAGCTFITLEDETGLVSIILTPQNFERYKIPIMNESVLMVSGELEDENGAIHVIAHHIDVLGDVHIKVPPSNDWG